MTPYLPPALFVTWPDPESHATFPVGRFVRVAIPEPAYEFAYIRAVLDAQGKGFSPFVTFPDLQEVYRSRELPPFFRNRLMPTARAGFGAHVAELGLERDASPEMILARSNGRRVTDPYEVFAELEPTSVPGEWQTWFFARSLRNLPHPGDLENLAPGDRLLAMRDVQNPANRHALALRTERNSLVGYCPAYLVDDLGTALDDPHAATITVERVNPSPAPLQHRLQCRLRIRPGPEFHGYRSGRFEPISPEALRLAPWICAAAVA
jgi:hypothetical protein